MSRAATFVVLLFLPKSHRIVSELRRRSISITLILALNHTPISIRRSNNSCWRRRENLWVLLNRRMSATEDARLYFRHWSLSPHVTRIWKINMYLHTFVISRYEFYRRRVLKVDPRRKSSLYQCVIPEITMRNPIHSIIY